MSLFCISVFKIQRSSLIRREYVSLKLGLSGRDCWIINDFVKDLFSSLKNAPLWERHWGQLYDAVGGGGPRARGTWWPFLRCRRLFTSLVLRAKTSFGDLHTITTRIVVLSSSVLSAVRTGKHRSIHLHRPFEKSQDSAIPIMSSQALRRSRRAPPKKPENFQIGQFVEVRPANTSDLDIDVLADVTLLSVWSSYRD